MQRLKDAGMDPAQPIFLQPDPSLPEFKAQRLTPSPIVSMVKPGIARIITEEEMQAHTNKNQPWFVVQGEVNIIVLSSPFSDSCRVLCRFTTRPDFLISTQVAHTPSR